MSTLRGLLALMASEFSELDVVSAGGEMIDAEANGVVWVETTKAVALRSKCAVFDCVLSCHVWYIVFVRKQKKSKQS